MRLPLLLLIFASSTKAFSVHLTKNRVSALRQSTSPDQEEPEASTVHHIAMEYCTGCRWMTRAFWMAQELLTTFNDDNLSAVTLVPSPPPPGAKFVVSYSADGSSSFSALM